MRAWQTPDLQRYLAERRASSADVPCPDRPGPDYVWENGLGWVVPAYLADRKALAEVGDFLAVGGRVLFEITFNHENRIRALEGKQPITRAQLRGALVDLIKSIS